MLKYFIAIGFIGILVVALVVYIFSSVGGPGETRRQKFDQTRIQQIQSLKYSIEDYYYKNKILPATIDDISVSLTPMDQIKDPETVREYDYKKLDEMNYQLCTNFKTDSAEVKQSNLRQTYYYYYYNEYKHPKGYHCFDYQVSPSGSTTGSPFTKTIILRPTGSGNFSQWTTQVPNSGFHWQKVSEEKADEDSSYIQASSDALWDDYAHEQLNIPENSVINSVTVWVRAKYITASINNIVAPAISAGSQAWEDRVITSSYDNYSATWGTIPNTSRAWTIADVNSAKIGVRKSYSGALVNVTQVWMEVTYTPPASTN